MVNLRLRVAFIGPATSGKTAMVQMIHSNGSTFPRNYNMTTGCDFVVKDMPVDEENSVEVTLLDVSGQRMYDRMVPAYAGAAGAFIIVYDASNKQTFETCGKWVQMAKEVGSNFPIYLVGNKFDLEDKIEVSDSQAESFAKAHDLKYCKASALRGTGITEPLDELAKLFFERYVERVALLAGYGE